MTDDPAGDQENAQSALLRARWPKATPRLHLRPVVAEDAAAVWEYRRLASVSRWLGSAQRTFDEFSDDFLRRQLPKTLVIIRTADQAIIGDLMLRIEDGWAQRDVADRARGVQAELGWVLDPRCVGQGYASEAVRAVIAVCFTDLALRRVTAGCFTANEPSWRLMERVGMRRESHTLQDSYHRELGWLDGYTYALLADEWQAQQ